MTAAVNNAFELIRNEIAGKRPSLQNFDKNIFPNNTASLPKPCSIVEISGNESSGKSKLLQYLMARVLAPQEFGGKHCRIIFLDLKHKFRPADLLRQIEMLMKCARLTENTENMIYTEDCNEVSLDCLNAVVLINCNTVEEFLLAINDVEQILMEDDNGEVGLIAIDGLDAFYWLDAYDKKISMRKHYSNLIEKLRSICMANNVCCFYTVSSNYLEAKGSKNKEAVHVEHALVLAHNPNTCRTLNGLPFTITNDGLTFF